MTWVKLDDQFADHPKIDGLSDAAFRLHLAGIIYCSRQLTDGKITESVGLRLTSSGKRRQISELCEAKLWDETSFGWVIHDYLDFQPSRAKVLDEREQAAHRQRKARESRRDSTVTHAEVREQSHLPRPDPTRIDSPSTTSAGVVDKYEDKPAPISVVKDAVKNGKQLLAVTHPRRESA